MFKLDEFVKKTIKAMVGKEPDYKVMKYALGWYDKEVLNDEDMAEIGALIEAQYAETETSEADAEEPAV